MDDNAKKQIEDLAKRIDDAESSLNAAKRILNRLNDDYLKVDYTQIDGIVGKYDGIKMLGEDGKEYEISANYAAKSKLVYGDVLKLIEEDGKKLFKQIERVNRERVEGILTKKEGEWYLLTDRGSYRVSDAAAEYQKAELNSQASAFLPADNLGAPFATLDNVEGASVIGKKPAGEKKVIVGKETNLKEIKSKESKEIDLKKEKKVEEKKERKSPIKKPPVKVKRAPANRAPVKKIPPKFKPKPAVKTSRPVSKEKVTEQVEQDDLV